MAYSLFEPAPFNSLFRRCVVCPSAAPTICPATCPTGKVCGQVPPTCDTCQQTTCVNDPNPTTATVVPFKSSYSRSHSGAIAGGVLGGVVAIAIATYLVWRFCIKTKRQQYEQEDWVEDHDEQMQAEKDFTMRRDARASTHTVGSIASTVLTRASNIIQIAYIPGVTNRSAPSTPGLLVPPVPPIPIALSSPSSSTRSEQEHFFMPGDLRDSTYSGVSGITDRTSYARTSVASTIYGKNAVVSPVPAQTVIRGKAAVVSVKSNGGHSPGEVTPPVPQVDYNKYRSIREPPSPAFSVGSTFLSSASAATQVKPQVVRMSSMKTSHPSQESQITILNNTPTIGQSPFSDPPLKRIASHDSLGAITKPSKANDSEKKGSTPFGDEHEVMQ